MPFAFPSESAFTFAGIRMHYAIPQSPWESPSVGFLQRFQKG
jgi:hypothetical protein